MVTVCFRVYSV